MKFLLPVLAFVITYFICFNLLFFFHKKMKYKLWNLIFILIISGSYFLLLLSYYKVSKNGNYRVLFYALPTGNISPFVFGTIPLTFILKDKVKDFYFGMISFLSIGMFVAMLFTPMTSFIRSNNPVFSQRMFFDSLSHMFCSLFGIYLILSKQVDLSIKRLHNSYIVIISVVMTIVFLNICFHTNFFGMSPYRDYNIYRVLYLPSFILTLLVYTLGIAIVMVSSFFLARLLLNGNFRKNIKSTTDDITSDSGKEEN